MHGSAPSKASKKLPFDFEVQRQPCPLRPSDSHKARRPLLLALFFSSSFGQLNIYYRFIIYRAFKPITLAKGTLVVFFRRVGLKLHSSTAVLLSSRHYLTKELGVGFKA